MKPCIFIMKIEIIEVPGSASDRDPLPMYQMQEMRVLSLGQENL